ncbi:hypothetical protein AVEN_247986-1 [Araneus ventricosus]|uniref:Uncharacterized protein n=1 Tax=Araneus ventricosus TaxID=182803 RepID=A0A4Y2CID7_ARAVE|nr:hypothetical protein AVEN_247986-1 [Araneus ventricosus]
MELEFGPPVSKSRTASEFEPPSRLLYQTNGRTFDPLRNIKQLPCTTDLQCNWNLDLRSRSRGQHLSSNSPPDFCTRPTGERFTHYVT